MIEMATLLEARTLLRRLELLSHGKTLKLEPTRGGEGGIYPPGGIAGKDDREPDHPHKSHVHYQRRLRGCRTGEDLKRVMREMEATLYAWHHAPNPPADSHAWKAKIAEDTRKPGVIARDYNISRQYVWQIKRMYGTQEAA